MNSIGVAGWKSRHSAATALHLGREPVAERPVAHLVVVLVEHHELLDRSVAGRCAEAAAAERHVVAREEVRLDVGRGELRGRAVVGVPAVAVTGEAGAQRVVEVVGPVGARSPSRPPPTGRIVRGSLRPLSAISSAPGWMARTRSVSSARRCRAPESTMAWSASTRRPSMCRSRIQCSALWSTHSRTAPDWASSKFGDRPHGVWYFSVK